MLLSVVCAGALGLTGAVLPGMSTFMLSATHQTTSTARPHSHGSHSVAWPLNPKAAQLDLPADVPQSRSAVPIAPMRLRHAEDATRTEKVPAPCHTAFPMVAFYTLKVLTIPLLWAIGRALAGARRARSAIRPEPRIALLATTGNAQDPYARVEEARVRAGKYDVEAVRDEIDTLVYSNPVVIFTQKNCGVCFQAIGLLNQVLDSYEEVHLDSLGPHGEAMRYELAMRTGVAELPVVFVAGACAGGLSYLEGLECQGQLRLALKKAGGNVKKIRSSRSRRAEPIAEDDLAAQFRERAEADALKSLNARVERWDFDESNNCEVTCPEPVDAAELLGEPQPNPEEVKRQREKELRERIARNMLMATEEEEEEPEEQNGGWGFLNNQDKSKAKPQINAKPAAPTNPYQPGYAIPEEEDPIEAMRLKNTTDESQVAILGVLFAVLLGIALFAGAPPPS
mmetsp:Transcript_49177/g.80882  ORF Transcript_49177/g.80882 Transcript_49177/m.80882 type:complete len:454 (-) Transcript_49177:267-1628(-)